MSVAWEDQTGQEEYDAADLITHFDTRAEKANANRQPELQQAPGYLLRQRSAAADGEAHLSGVVTDALGGAHIRMFATPRSRDWKDNGEHSYMLTVGFLQSVNMAPSPEIRCDMVLSKRDRTKEPLREALDLKGEGRREQQRLTVSVAVAHDVANVVDKAHVEHAVGFVDDDDLNIAQADKAAAHIVHHAAGGPHQDVDGTLQLSGLFLPVHSAIDRDDV